VTLPLVYEWILPGMMYSYSALPVLHVHVKSVIVINILYM
jgi:hypothetical protein